MQTLKHLCNKLPPKVYFMSGFRQNSPLLLMANLRAYNLTLNPDAYLVVSQVGAGKISDARGTGETLANGVSEWFF